jgi:hypothetical protein
MGIYLQVNGRKALYGSINAAYTMPVRQLTFGDTSASGLDIGTAVTAYINETKMFTGTIKSVTRRRPGQVYEFMAEDVLCRSLEYWFAPANLDEGFTWSNINNIDLTLAMLTAAQITDVVDDWSPYPTFQFAVGPEPFKITIASSWDTISMINQVTGQFVYADENGQVHISRIWSEPGSVVSHAFVTGNSGTLKTLEYYRTDENLRNRIVCYGYQGVYGEASAVSPYTPAGFYRTATISSELLISNAMATETAQINLAQLNKLTESVIADVIGDTSVNYLQTVSITDPKIVLSGNWFISQCEHRVDPTSGYTCRLTCSK